MGQNVQAEAGANRSYQEQLARSLVACLGWEEAVHACSCRRAPSSNGRPPRVPVPPARIRSL
jgi:hypothetical protein